MNVRLQCSQCVPTFCIKTYVSNDRSFEWNCTWNLHELESMGRQDLSPWQYSISALLFFCSFNGRFRGRTSLPLLCDMVRRYRNNDKTKLVDRYDLSNILVVEDQVCVVDVVLSRRHNHSSSMIEIKLKPLSRSPTNVKSACVSSSY